MNPRLIEKIRALADDVRGDAATRANAQRKLNEYMVKTCWTEALARMPPRNPPNPRTQPSEEYEKFRFMNMDSWRTTSLGTLIITIKGYRIGLFKFKKNWGWTRYTLGGDVVAQSNTASHSSTKFATMDEARRDAWDKLMTL